MELKLDLFNISLPSGGTAFGLSQDWFPDRFKRTAGCGSVAAANIFLYYFRQYPCDKINLFDAGARFDRPGVCDVLPLMEEMWRFFTPGFMGLHKVADFISDAKNFGHSRGRSFETDVLEVPKNKKQRPDQIAAAAFIDGALKEGFPVAFLNLSNGGIKGLDSWHWVTIVSCDASDGLTVTAADYGKRITVDIARWLESSALGGGFAVIKR